MKLRYSLPLILLGTTLAVAQPGYQAPPSFSHVVIIFQENRTPDNLFGAGAGPEPTCGSEYDFEHGVDIDNGGPNLASQENGGPYVTCLAANSGLITGGGYHGHNGNDTGHPNEGWVPQCDYSSSTGSCQMDGACLGTWPNCPQYQFVDKPAVQPYFDIATNYGFANYMFSTHEGPSFPAHQFIFGGSSAPVWPGDTYYQWFVAEQPGDRQHAGCPATSGWPNWVDPDNNDVPGKINSQCYDRNTLVTYQDSNGVVHDWTASWSLPYPAWKYYVPVDNSGDPLAGVWNAPADDPQICYFSSSGGRTACDPLNNSEYMTHVSVAQNSNMMSAPILTDIGNCQLPAISWVIPDERWSDHPGNFDLGMGPDWVAAVVDAIGQSASNSGGVCDYWGTSTTAQRIEPTVIFITWDDWGGFYDHVPPPAMYFGNGSDQCTPTSGNANSWGCGYVYGFRVPLLVASEWTPASYVSGALPPYGPGEDAAHTHDFGSILAFTENNFNLPPIAPQTPVKYTYADQNSLDRTYNGLPAVPLWDFFLGPQRAFTYISPILSTHTASFFENYYYDTGQSPLGPEEVAPGVNDPLD